MPNNTKSIIANVVCSVFMFFNLMVYIIYYWLFGCKSSSELYSKLTLPNSTDIESALYGTPNTSHMSFQICDFSKSSGYNFNVFFILFNLISL